MSQRSASSNSNKSQQNQKSRSRQKPAASNSPKKDNNIQEKEKQVQKEQEKDVYYSYRQFCELYPQEGKQKIQELYDTYKTEWLVKKNQQFYQEHKNDAWLNEKYNPQILDISINESKQNSLKMYVQFIKKYNEGLYKELNLKINSIEQIGTHEQIQQQNEENKQKEKIQSNIIIETSVHPTIAIDKSPYFGYNSFKNVIIMRSISKNISKYDIKAALAALQGLKWILMSYPSKKNEYKRFCWIQYDTEQNCNKAFSGMNGLLIKGQSFLIGKCFPKIQKVRVLSNYPESRLQKDISLMQKLIKKYDQLAAIKHNPLLICEMASLEYKFDILVLYLRNVHFFDYFTCKQYENLREISLKTSISLLRIQTNESVQQNKQIQEFYLSLEKNVEEKLSQLEKKKDHMLILREKLQQQLKQEYQKQNKALQTQQLEFWKCKLCDKKFKTCEFLAKHIIVRHEQISAKRINEYMHSLYMNDQNKITTHPPINDRNKRLLIRQRYTKRPHYRDLDEPKYTQVKQEKITKALVNYLDI